MHFKLKYIFVCTIVILGTLVTYEFVKSNGAFEQTSKMTVWPTPTMTVKQFPATETKYSPWKLIWQDEFDDRYLDKQNWITDVNDWGGGNEELQYYTDRDRNVYIANGLLNIVAQKERYLTRDYTSARLTSVRSWTYGRFEIKANLPEGQGIWPAIWLRAATNSYGFWPASGEIDIMEMLGHEPTVIYGTLHYGSPWPHNEKKQGSAILAPQEFHVFTVEWDIDEIKWYVDDANYFTVDTWYTTGGEYPAPFDQPFNIVLNLAVGGTWPGNPDETTSFPQRLLIDYVRVYRK